MANNAIRIAILANARSAIRNLNRTGRAVDQLDRTARRAARGGVAEMRKSLDGLGRIAAKATGGLKAGGKALGVSLMGFVALGVASGAAQVASALSAGLLAATPALGVLPGFALAAASALGVLKVATSGVADAMSLGLKAAMSGLPKDIEEYNDALAKMAPAAADFVDALVKMRSQLDKVRNAIAGKFFAGMATEIKKLAGTWLPLLSKHGEKVATSMNRAALEVGAFVREGGTIGSIRKIFGNVEKAIDNAAGALKPLAQGLLPLFSVSATFLPGLTSGFGDAAKRFAAFMEQAEKSGAMKDAIQGGLDALKGLFGLLKDVGSILKSVFVDGNTGATSLFGTIGTLIKQVATFLNTADGMKAIGAVWQVFGQIGTALGDALKVVLPAFGKALVAIAPAVGPLVTAMSKFLQTLAPLLPILGKVAAVIMGELAKALPILAPMLLEIGKTIGALLTAAAPLLPIIAKIAAVIGKALAKAVTALLPAVGPLVTALGTGLLTVITALAPILPLLARVFAKLIDAVTPLIAPIAALVAQFVTGLVPIIEKMMPSLDKLLAALGPALLAILAALAPAMPVIIEAMAALVPPTIALLNAVIPLIPQITALAVMMINKLLPIMVTSAPAVRVMTGSIYLLIAAVKGIWGALSAAVTGFGNFFTTVKTSASGFLDWMLALPGKIIDGLVSGLAAGWGRVTSFFQSAIDLIPQGIQDALGISSPSKVMAGLGANITKGLAVGIKAQVPAVAKAMGVVSDAVSSGVATDTTVKLRADARITGTGHATGALAPITIHVSVANGVDPVEVGRKTVAAIDAWQKMTGRQRLVNA